MEETSSMPECPGCKRADDVEPSVFRSGRRTHNEFYCAACAGFFVPVKINPRWKLGIGEATYTGVDGAVIATLRFDGVQWQIEEPGKQPYTIQGNADLSEFMRVVERIGA
jgi:hypothetical protein